MNPDPRPSPPAARWSWWGVAAMGVIVLGVPTLLALGPAPRRPFDEKPLRLLKKERPAVVLLGDSMLDTRIDSKVLNRLAGQRCFVLAQPGSSSAAWYLMFKNLVAVQTPPPRTVIILYRSRQLTLPTHRAVGDYRKSMEPYMRDAEPVLEKLVGPVRKSTGPLDDMVQVLYPLDRMRERAQDKMQAWALDLVASSREYEEIHNAAKILFSPKNLRVGNVVDEQQEGGAASLDPNDHDFAASVDASFLPPLLEIAREKGIQLVFYKVKRRPNPDGTLGEESQTSEEYDQALRAYVEKAGARFFDETQEPDITVDLYGSGDHVAPAMMPRYTELFWQKIGKMVNAEPVR
jgi:hypothetical protein